LINAGAIKNFLARLAVAALALVLTAEGLAGVELRDIVQEAKDAMWQAPEYTRIQAS
jgi:hypothetical protein